ncbi:hypothetical protein K458DRAFT_247105, partial [Lentithecium fluviatile CBS 122367]
KKGFVYILRDPTRPRLVKIGASINTGKRREQIMRDCNVGLETVFVSDEVDNHMRVEQLAQGDLWHLQRPYTCPKCLTEHREWHDVGDELAKATVTRWVDFMKQQPYTSAGTLKPIWQRLVDKRRLSRPPNEEINHESRWQHWESVLLP